MSQQREPIYDAIILPADPLPPPSGHPPRRRRLWGWLAAGGGVVLTVSVFVVIIIWGTEGHRETRPRFVPADSLARKAESPAERRAGILAAFNGRQQPLTDPDLPRIERLLEYAALACESGDDAGFRKFVDFDRLLLRIEKQPDSPELTRLEARSLRDRLRQDLPCPPGIKKLTLLRLKRAGKDELLAHAYAVTVHSDYEPYRLWLCRDGNDWKLFDWESVDSGLSESGRWARLLALRDHPQRASYELGADTLQASERLQRQGDLRGAAERLQMAEQLQVPRVIHDAWQYWLAYYWNALGDGPRCLAACRRAIQPDEAPGFHALQAQWLFKQGQFEAALAAARKY